jgi:uncharacterized membrane protein
MIRNLSLSLILSVILTFIGAVLYVFSPILKLIFGNFLTRIFTTNAETSGIAVVAGGVSASIFPVALLTAVILFLIIFTLLQRRSRAGKRRE